MRTVIGQQIRRYRQRRGLTQAVLAQLVGRSERWLIEVEQGHVDPRLSDALLLAQALSIEIAELVREVAVRPMPAARPPPRRKVCRRRAVRRLTPTARRPSTWRSPPLPGWP
jgi:transcriptional regulator with XRE-family HTH domain